MIGVVLWPRTGAWSPLKQRMLQSVLAEPVGVKDPAGATGPGILHMLRHPWAGLLGVADIDGGSHVLRTTAARGGRRTGWRSGTTCSRRSCARTGTGGSRRTSSRSGRSAGAGVGGNSSPICRGRGRRACRTRSCGCGGWSTTARGRSCRRSARSCLARASRTGSCSGRPASCWRRSDGRFGRACVPAASPQRRTSDKRCRRPKLI